jgi:hypothetical protein
MQFVHGSYVLREYRLLAAPVVVLHFFAMSAQLGAY